MKILMSPIPGNLRWVCGQRNRAVQLFWVFGLENTSSEINPTPAAEIFAV